MVYLQGFEDPDAPSVVLGVYVADIIISNDGYAFVELSTEQARELAAHAVSEAEKAEESLT